THDLLPPRGSADLNALNTLNQRDAEDVLRRQLQAVRHNEVVPGSQVAVARVRDVLESLLQVLERQAPGRGVTRDSLVTRPHGGEGQEADDLHVLLLSGTAAELSGGALEDAELPVVDDGLPRDLEGNTVLLGLESLTRGTEPDALVLTVRRHAGEGTLEVRLTSGRVSDVRVRAVPLGGEIVLRTEVIDNLTRGDLGPDPMLILVLIQHDLVERRGEQGRVVRGRDTLNQTLLSLAVAVKRLSHDLSGLNLPL